ncbi:LysR family transcriptional regulator, partial [Staphylococcus epidermidis]
ISFNKINKLQYKLEYTKVIKLMLFGANDNSDMPMFVNSDKQCPIRLLSLDVKEKSREIIEIDSLAAIINLIQSGKGIALLPIVIGKNRGLTNLSLKSYDLKYYKYIKA